ncbi:MAG: WecB/TagA/CpsF family glycosyltransferase [Planctomycetota bacterium]|nr:WecB/TagA/CpsF family glycosyltransferase [Planctomycetota bacterium]
MDYGRAETKFDGICPPAESEPLASVETAGPWAMTQRIVAFVACALLLPLLAVLYPLVRCSSRGPFLFSQLRRGYRGKPFLIYKIRTMHLKGEKPTVQSVLHNHPDTTRVGRVLRELKIDELLQLWNVVRGDMALVGPRPIPTDLDDFLLERIPNFKLRNNVLPGLTSVAQLAARSNTHSVESILEDWKNRHELDLLGMHNKSFTYDLYVLGKTVLYMLRQMLQFLLLVPRHDARPAEFAGTRRATLVLGTPIVNASYEQIIQQIKEWTEQRSRHYIGVVAVHNIVLAKWRPSHRRALQQASINTPDGMPIVWAQRLLGHRGASRVAGCSLMPMVLEHAETQAWRVAFYGGAPDRLRQLVANMSQRFPRLNIVDAISPPFRHLNAQEDQEMVDRLNARRPDIVFVGLGCPKQERWMLEHIDRVPAVMIGVGAAFDLHAGAVPPTPQFLQKAGLEWLFRLCCQPRRLFIRYATTNPTYVAMILWQLFKRFVLRRDYQVALNWPQTPTGKIQVQVFRNTLRAVDGGFATGSVSQRHDPQSDAVAASSAAIDG